MLKHLALVAMLASTSTLALAQSAAPNAPICDGSAIRRAERVRDTGRALFIGTAGVDLVAALTIPRNPGGVGTARSHLGFMAATVPIAFAGLFMANNAHPGERFWQGVIARLKVGETRAADVQLCLHRPAVWSSSISGERWTYVIARPSGLGGSLRSLHLTFRDSVLTDVQRTEVQRYAYAGKRRDSTDGPLDRHHGFCVPPTTVIPDPFPTPTDTTFAAAAMARAKADADAAMKNASASAEYAACLASDSAR